MTRRPGSSRLAGQNKNLGTPQAHHIAPTKQRRCFVAFHAENSAAETWDDQKGRRMDTLTTAKRSELMSRIRSTGTTPELRAEAAAKRLRRRPATHDRSLPGRPDMAFPRSKAAVFVHGCFWHQHAGCAKARVPKSNAAFWTAKFAANRARDRRAARELRAMGWTVLTIWECETMDPAGLRERLAAFLREATNAVRGVREPIGRATQAKLRQTLDRPGGRDVS